MMMIHMGVASFERQLVLNPGLSCTHPEVKSAMRDYVGQERHMSDSMSMGEMAYPREQEQET